MVCLPEAVAGPVVVGHVLRNVGNAFLVEGVQGAGGERVHPAFRLGRCRGRVEDALHRSMI